MPQSERNWSASWICIYILRGRKLKQYCATLLRVFFYLKIKILHYVIAFNVRLKLAIIIKDRRQIEQSHFVNGMDFCSLTCSLFSVWETIHKVISFGQKCLIKDIKSFIKTSLIAGTSKKKYAANYVLQLRNDLLIMKNKTLLLRNGSNWLNLYENIAFITNYKDSFF